MKNKNIKKSFDIFFSLESDVEDMKKLNFWKKFWGKRYRIYKNNKEVKEILIYKHQIYILKNRGV